MRNYPSALFVFVAGYEAREAIEYGNWKLAFMAACLLGLAWVYDDMRKEKS
jgi:hypothetical protein